MLRHLKIWLASTLALGLLAGCGGSGTAQPQYETRTGVIAPLTGKAPAPSTHQLLTNGKVTALLVAAEPAQLNLANYLGKNVELSGILAQTTTQPAQDLLKVVSVKVLTGDAPNTATGSRRYRDEAAGFSVDYAARLTPRPGAHGVAFYVTEQQKLVDILVLQNPLEQALDKWLMDKYGYKQAELQKVGVAGLSGYRFQNTTGAVIYLARGAEVLALAWYDNDAANRETQRKTYLEIVQSLTTFPPTAVAGGSVSTETATTSQNLVGLGSTCGGGAQTNCAAGMTCQRDTSKTDGSGTCVTLGGNALISRGLQAGSIAAATDLPAQTELERTRGWYYGDRTAKKQGTPDDWILVNPETSFAMWRRPTELPEITPKLGNPTATASELTRDQQAVLTYLQAQIGQLAPETAKTGAWQLQQVAFADPNYAYATYAAGAQTRRILLSYTAVGSDVVATAQAYFRPVEGDAWLTLEGADLAANKSLTVVAGQSAAASTVAPGMRSLQNRGAGYQLQYPADWYWQPASVGRTEFSDRPFPAGTALITAEVVAGQTYKFGEAVPSGQQFVIFVKLKNNLSLKLAAAGNQLELLKQMAASVQVL